MKYFKDSENKLFAFEDDGSQDEYIGDKTEITEAEALAITNPPKTQAELDAARVSEIDARLKAIDGESVRPLVAIAAGVQTTFDTDKLAALSTEAQALRVERAALYVAP